MPNSPVGVDISNTHLDVYVVPAGQAARFPNDAAGFTALIAWIAGPVRAVTYAPNRTVAPRLRGSAAQG